MADTLSEVGDQPTVGGKFTSSIKWGFNQFHPFGEGGKLGRTLTGVTALAVSGAAFAASGVPVPIEVTGSLATTTSTASAASASAIATGGAKATLWDGASGYAKDVMSHAWNGASVYAEGIKNIATGADWSAAYEALAPEG